MLYTLRLFSCMAALDQHLAAQNFFRLCIRMIFQNCHQGIVAGDKFSFFAFSIRSLIWGFIEINCQMETSGLVQCYTTECRPLVYHIHAAV